LIPDFQIVAYWTNIILSNTPYINGKLIYSALGLCINFNLKKLTHVTGFVVQGHILYMLNLSVGYFFSVWNLQLYKMFYITY